MRQSNIGANLSVQAIAGTEVVLLGMDVLEPQAIQGLLGFRIYKRQADRSPVQLLGSGRQFEDSPNPVPMIQAFLWSDYVVDPSTTYTYLIEPVYGRPGALEPRQGVEVTITTEDPEDHTHAIYFNRGVAGSQAYSQYFGEYRKWYQVTDGFRDRKVAKEFIKPADVPDRRAYQWLSRGLEEAMLGFIRLAENSDYALRASVYEFTYKPAIQAFVDALERGADVQIIHHAKREKRYRLKRNYDAATTVTFADHQSPVTFDNREVVLEEIKDDISQAADAAVSSVGLTDFNALDAFNHMLIERTDTTISHNKFIVLLYKGQPQQVWTGSTNFTEGGIFGQSNVGHIVRDPAIAQRYSDYWQKLVTDPPSKSKSGDPEDHGIRHWTLLQQPDLEGPPPPHSITPIFSPRSTKAMLDWYAEQFAAAQQSVFFTAAFSVADEI